MKYSAILIVIILFSSCKQEHRPEKEVQVILSGVIENPKEDIVRFSYGEQKDTAYLDSSGAFRLALQFDEASYATFEHGNEYTGQYLSPGDSLHLSLNTEAFDQTLVYSGTGEHVNNYLAKQLLKEVEGDMDIRKLYGLNFDVFQFTVDSIKHSKLALLNEMSNETFTDEFLQLEKGRIVFDWAREKMNYPNYHQYYAEEPEDLDLNNDYYDYLDTLDINNPAFLDIKEFHSFSNAFLLNKMSEIMKDSSFMGKTVFLGKFQAVLNEFDNQEVKDYMLYNTLRSHLSYSTKDVSDEIMERFEKHCKNEKYVTEIHEKLASWESLQPGNPAPDFEGVDVEGKLMTLNDFRGSYVYIDVWATWCGPCKHEIPFLEELHEEYKDENIIFVSVSLDRDKESWKKMVTEKEMKGIQLYTKNDFKSTLAKEYNIGAIPRFILIDTEGNIMDVNAPRPSGEIRDVFDSFKEV